MSFWRRSTGKRDEPPPATPTAPSAPLAPQPERSVLAALAAGDVVDERAALDELDRLRGTTGEKAALVAVEAAAARGLATEALCTRAAEIALARGEPERALGLLADSSSPAALVLAADASAETGAVAQALTLIERVLARDIDAPGARERHERWRRSLGARTPAAVSALAEPTLLRAEAPDTSLRIVGEAGRGGAGTVYEAVDDALGRRVALKIYHRPERERDKLAREARTAVALTGVGVVRVYDVDLDKGLLVMEWLGGGSLKQAIARRDTALLFPVERWLIPLVRTLARVHDAGWVHADLKPANVMFRAPGQPVLSDFGLAHRGACVVEGGSVGYMSPARVRGDAVGFAEDLYGVGRLIEDVIALGGAPEQWRRLASRLLAADPGWPDAGRLAALLAEPA
ncbi:MAG: serine/threonine protein kinase [Polyangiaceae bacterium]|nr:serine/threonine protein kinase [Polyangiaceae bacterium]